MKMERPPSAFNELLAGILEAIPGHAKLLNGALAMLEPSELAEADSYVAYLLRTHDMGFLVESYKTLVDDTKEVQFEFQKTGKYRHATLKEVADSVYFRPDYMERYMLGLALSTFLWANHIVIYRFFRTTLPPAGESYLEIGPGHGFFLLHALRHCRYRRHVGIDISPSSVALTRDALRHLGGGGAVELVQRDFLDDNALQGPFDTIVMGEVIEHVERPGAFLRRAAALAHPGSHIFVTTCVNAPAIDHIYHFRRLVEIEELFSACGLTVRDSRIVPYAGKTLKQCDANDLPINVAYVLAPCQASD